MTREREAPSSRIDTRPFFESGAIDALLQMVLALGSELSAVSEKLDTLVDLLVDEGMTRAADVDHFVPNAEQQAKRAAARQRLVHALLAPYDLEAEALAQRASDERSKQGARPSGAPT